MFSKSIRAIFSLHEEDGRGRAAMMFAAVGETLLAQLTGGIFYTGFLVAYDFNIVRVGILTFIPFAANIAGVFITPPILRKFKRRKLVITLSRILYNLINILGITLLPVLVSDNSIRLVWMIAIIFVSNLINSISVSGYSAWYLNFLPERVRADYFSVSQFLSSFIPGVMLLVSSAVADKLAGSPYQLVIIITLRYVALFAGMIDVIILALPKEYPYAESGSFKISDVLVKPFHNKPYIQTMFIVLMWQFSASAYSSLFNVYLLNTVGVSYMFFNIIVATYSLFFIFFSGFWKRLISRWSWFRVYGTAMLINIPAQFILAFVSPTNYIPLMLATRYTQHFMGVGQNICYANFQFIFMPKDDRITYTSFYLLVVNVGNLAGCAFGTSFLALLPNFSMHLFGATLGGVPLLVMLNAAMSAILAPYAFHMSKKYDSNRV
jgi:Major Facilitator Superfamily.